MFGYVLAIGAVLVTGVYSIPVGNPDQDVDSSFLRRPSLEDELRDLPYEEHTNAEDEGNKHQMQLVASTSDNGLESLDETGPGAGSAMLGNRFPAAGGFSSPPPAPLPSHLIDIDSNVNPSALSTATDVEDAQEKEWRPEDDEKDDADDTDDVDDDEDDNEEDDNDPEDIDEVKEKKSGDDRPSTTSGPPSQTTPSSQQQQQKPAYIRETYFLAKEDKTDDKQATSKDSATKVVSDALTVSGSQTGDVQPSAEIHTSDVLESTGTAIPIHQGGQKEQFAEVVVKLEPTEEHEGDAVLYEAPVQSTVQSATNYEHPSQTNVGGQDIDGTELLGTSVTSTGNDAVDAVSGTVASGDEISDHQPHIDSPEEDIEDSDEDTESDELESEEGKIKEEITNRLQSINAGRKLVKKVMPLDTQKLKNANKDESANEDILELIIKVAEKPSSWKEIKELLEKIQYEENTLNKAKTRLKALAKQKQMKNQKEQKNKENKIRKNRTKYNPKDQQNDTLPKEHRFNKASEMTPDEPGTGGHGGSAYNGNTRQEKVPLHKNDDIIKAEVIPSAARHNDRPSKHPKHHHGRRLPVDMVGDDHDFAIEKPVTVIGERSRIDPVEKELIEASTNQRLREIQKEKARLEAIPEPTDEMEQQLKTMTKMERRLKEHWRQKQKLIQKIRMNNEEHKW